MSNFDPPRCASDHLGAPTIEAFHTWGYPDIAGFVFSLERKITLKWMISIGVPPNLEKPKITNKGRGYSLQVGPLRNTEEPATGVLRRQTSYFEDHFFGYPSQIPYCKHPKIEDLLPGTLKRT